MSFLLFAPDNVKALKAQAFPEWEERRPIFDYDARSMILRAASDLSREMYVHLGEAIGEGPLCYPLWRRDAGLVPMRQLPTMRAARERALRG